MYISMIQKKVLEISFFSFVWSRLNKWLYFGWIHEELDKHLTGVRQRFHSVATCFELIASKIFYMLTIVYLSMHWIWLSRMGFIHRFLTNALPIIYFFALCYQRLAHYRKHIGSVWCDPIWRKVRTVWAFVLIEWICAHSFPCL
jgi:hypothetical protein